MKSDGFVNAVENKDLDSLSEVLADDVRFLSPVVFRPYEGKELVTGVLSMAAKVLEEFTYVWKLEDDGGAVLVFEARVGDRAVDGVDFLTFDADGSVAELKVMVRPMSGVNALAEAMGRELDALGISPPTG
ncbi:MAG: nuclear transport factor 2 family protein [Solirubrobacterales bacterium]